MVLYTSVKPGNRDHYWTVCMLYCAIINAGVISGVIIVISQYSCEYVLWWLWQAPHPLILRPVSGISFGANTLILNSIQSAFGGWYITHDHSSVTCLQRFCCVKLISELGLTLVTGWGKVPLNGTQVICWYAETGVQLTAEFSALRMCQNRTAHHTRIGSML